MGPWAAGWEVMARKRRVYSQEHGRGIEVKYILDVRTFPDSPFAQKFVGIFR
jgi:hypothetical protein